MEEESNIIQLTDEDGNEIEFEHVMTVEHEGSYYIVLEATADMDDCKEGEAVILKIVKDEQGEECYATIEDEAEFQAVYEKCVELMEEDQNEEFGEYDDADTDEGDEDK